MMYCMMYCMLNDYVYCKMCNNVHTFPMNTNMNTNMKYDTIISTRSTVIRRHSLHHHVRCSMFVTSSWCFTYDTIYYMHGMSQQHTCFTFCIISYDVDYIRCAFFPFSLSFVSIWKLREKRHHPKSDIIQVGLHHHTVWYIQVPGTYSYIHIHSCCMAVSRARRRKRQSVSDCCCCCCCYKQEASKQETTPVPVVLLWYGTSTSTRYHP